MDINVTLFGEMLTFAVLVWVMMKYVWPPLMQAIGKRQQQITSGLEAAERNKQELELTRANIVEQLRQTKLQAAALLNQANQQVNDLVAKGKEDAQVERDKILAQAQIDIEQKINSTKLALQQQTVNLVLAVTEKMLQQNMDNVTQEKLINKLISSI